MSLGEIPASATLRGYWHLEDVNDATSNGFNLTNQNTVTFSTCKFNNGADFGSSGTNKALTYSTNPLSANEPTNVSVSFWFKLNTTGSSNSNARFFELVTLNSSTSGLRLICYYNISGGTQTITFATTTTSGLQTVTRTTTANTVRKQVTCIKAGGTIYLAVNNGQFASLSVADRTTSGLPALLYNLAIGNSTFGLTQSAWAVVDDFFITETDFSKANGYNKYYTQAAQGFCI